jgi:hypothetical protein
VCTYLMIALYIHMTGRGWVTAMIQTMHHNVIIANPCLFPTPKFLSLKFTRVVRCIPRLPGDQRKRYSLHIRTLATFLSRVNFSRATCSHRTFGKHSGNIQGTLGEQSGNIQGTSSEHKTRSGNNQRTFREHNTNAGDIQGALGEHLGNIWGTCLGNIQGTFREHFGNILGTAPIQHQ